MLWKGISDPPRRVVTISPGLVITIVEGKQNQQQNETSCKHSRGMVCHGRLVYRPKEGVSAIPAYVRTTRPPGLDVYIRLLLPAVMVVVVVVVIPWNRYNPSLLCGEESKKVADLIDKLVLDLRTIPFFSLPLKGRTTQFA